MTVLTFAGLTWAAIAMRRRTDWHRRLHYCGTAMLMAPAISRLLPSPLLMPYAYEAAFVPVLIFPAIGIVAALRRGRRVHPAWWCGGAVLACSLIATELLTFSPAGTAIYRAVTAGTPGAAVPPLAFGSPPPAPRSRGSRGPSDRHGTADAPHGPRPARRDRPAAQRT